MRTVVGGTRRAAPPQVQPRPDLRHYFATNQWEASWAGLHVQPRPRCSPASICRLQPGVLVLLGQRAAVYQKLTSQSEWIAVKPAPTRGLCQNSKRKCAKRKRNLWQRIQNPRFAKTNLWKSLTKNEAYLKSMLNLCDWVIFFRFHCVFLLL